MICLCSRRLQLTRHVLTNVNSRPKPRSTAVSFYSKRSNSENHDVYKVVKSGNSVNESDKFSSDMNSNWELLAPKGYRFYLPGNVGPAWYDQYSTAQFTDLTDLNMMDGTPDTSCILECVAQVCPLLLRKGVLEMFPNINEISNSQLTVVTLSQKSPKGVATETNDVEQEKRVKTFVLVAQEICMKLDIAGYWADFINPFSGLPYLSHSFKNSLYETDQRFRCLGFEITNRNNCKVIDSKEKITRKFVGSLFTTAPANVSLLREILNQYED